MDYRLSLVAQRCSGSARLVWICILQVDQTVAVRVGEGEHRRHSLHPDQLVVVQSHSGFTDLVVGLLSVWGAQPDRHRDLAVRRQQDQGDLRTRWYDLDHPGAGPYLDVGS